VRYRGSLGSAALGLLDGLAVLGIGWLTTFVYHNVVFDERYAVLLLVLLVAMGLTYERFGVYASHRRFLNEAFALAKAWLVAFAVLLTIAFLAKETEAYSRLVLIALFTGGLAAQGANHLAFRLLQHGREGSLRLENALLVGTGPLAEQLYQGLRENPWIGQRAVGAVSVGPSSTGAAPEPAQVPLLGTVADVERLIDDLGIRTVYLLTDLTDTRTIQRLYFNLLDRNVNVHWIPNIFTLELINYSIGELVNLPLITLSETPLVGMRRMIKDVEDKLLASLGLLLISPLLLAIAVAIKLDSPGPVFFRQYRTGWDGRTFRIWKFRTMRVEAAEAEGPVRQATRDDPRVTRVGRILRRTSLDELPQLFNVLAGEMSLVGPRPHAVAHNVQYSQQIKAYLARHRIKPGITGLAQVRGLRGETEDLTLMSRRVRADLEYINNWSIWLDLSILARTLFALTGRNAY
jgi:putative colanic acid biosynthesis UDP-glucose lipid carrier transferase